MGRRNGPSGLREDDDDDDEPANGNGNEPLGMGGTGNKNVIPAHLYFVHKALLPILGLLFIGFFLFCFQLVFIARQHTEAILI